MVVSLLGGQYSDYFARRTDHRSPLDYLDLSRQMYIPDVV